MDVMYRWVLQHWVVPKVAHKGRLHPLRSPCTPSVPSTAWLCSTCQALCSEEGAKELAAAARDALAQPGADPAAVYRLVVGAMRRDGLDWFHPCIDAALLPSGGGEGVQAWQAVWKPLSSRPMPPALASPRSTACMQPARGAPPCVPPPVCKMYPESDGLCCGMSCAVLAALHSTLTRPPRLHPLSSQV